VAYIFIALLRTSVTAGMEQMHRVERHYRRQHGQLTAADTAYDEWSWSSERQYEEDNPLDSALLFDPRLRWILEIAASTSGNICIRENTKWARGSDKDAEKIFAKIFLSHHPARIATVTSWRWKIVILVILVGFDAVVMITYCSDEEQDCTGDNISSWWHALSQDKAMAPSLIATSSMGYWILLMLVNVGLRYNFYYHVVRIFTLIHTDTEDIPDYELKWLRRSKLKILDTSRRSLEMSQVSNMQPNSDSDSNRAPLLTDAPMEETLFNKKAFDAMCEESRLRQMRKLFKDAAGIKLGYNCNTVRQWYMTRLLLKRECAQMTGTPALEIVVLLAALAIIALILNIFVYLKWLEQADEGINGDWATDVTADAYCSTVLALFMLWVLCRCAMTSGMFESQLEQVRYADFATLTTLLYYEQKIDQMAASTPTTPRGRSTSNASVKSSNTASPSILDMQNPDINGDCEELPEDKWDAEKYNDKRKELIDTRRMLNCVLQQLRDVDQSQMIAGVPVTWNVLKAAAGVIGSIWAVLPG
jgi:hypothetical protein